jgi:hypothetical protein
VRSAEPFVGTDPVTTTLGRVLGLRRAADRPTVHDEGDERLDGVLIRRLRWSVGYGPDTTAWLLRPARVRRTLPGILGMHCHGGVAHEHLLRLHAGTMRYRGSFTPGVTPSTSSWSRWLHELAAPTRLRSGPPGSPRRWSVR